MKFGVVVFPGSNCDRDCFYVIQDVLKQPVEFIWHKQSQLTGFDCIVIPGGFSYGDYLRCGAIARFSPVMKPVIDFAHEGGLVLGICNGFQVLLESGLLPGAMLRNRDLNFICKYVYIRIENNMTSFTNLYKKGDILKIPIAHYEGNYYINENDLKTLEENKQVVFHYCSREGDIKPEANPNGALANIAGIINKEGNVLGMMPHPERCSENELGSGDGFLIFKSIVSWLERK